MLARHVDPIVAIATAPGRGGVGVIRISGANLLPLAEQLSGKTPRPRCATLADFRAADGSAIDSGLLLTDVTIGWRMVVLGQVLVAAVVFDRVVQK